MLLILAASAALFDDITGAAIGTTGEWSNKVVLDDLDGDGDLDIAFANGGNYSSAGSPEPNRVFLNEGGAFAEVTLPGGPDLSRSLKAGDLDGDGIPELLASGVFETRSRLFAPDGLGGFEEQSDRLPDTLHSFGDLELGDVDGDGDLDVVLADWGPGNPLSNAGGRTRLWRNDGGVFTDVTDTAMPDVAVRMSWDLELADVDNDFDLDVLVSSKGSAGSFLFENDGSGSFSDVSARLPQFTNNYEFAPMDVNGDGFLDLVTINDGNNLREHLFLNDGTGTFESGNGTAWPASENLGEDDNIVEFIDLDDDGDPDFVIGSLSGEDRALINDGGVFTLFEGAVFGGGPTPGTLSMAFGDFDGDGRPDAVMAQGEAASADKVFRGASVMADTHPPVIAAPPLESLPSILTARVHDRMTPIRPSDLSVEVVLTSSAAADPATPVQRRPMTWVGGQLWRADLPSFDQGRAEICATDRSGNETCLTLFDHTPLDTDGPDTDGTAPADPCGCAASPPSMRWLGPLGALALRRR